MLTQAQSVEVGAAVCSKNLEVLSQPEIPHRHKQKLSLDRPVVILVGRALQHLLFSLTEVPSGTFLWAVLMLP